MADPLSILASVLTVAGSGLAIAKGLYTLADGLGSAGESARIYADEIHAFSNMLANIREELSKAPEHSWSPAEHLTKEILDICKRLLQPANKLQAKLNPLLVSYRNSPSKLLQIRIRIRWVFSAEDKLLRYRGSLQALTLVLNTTLRTVNLRANANSSNTSFIQQNLVLCIDRVHRSLNNPMQLAHAGFLQPPVQPLLPSNTRAAIMNGASTESIMRPLAGHSPQQITFSEEPTLQTLGVDVEVSQTPDGSSDEMPISRMSQALIRSPLQEEEFIEGLDGSTTNESTEIDQKICDTIEETLYQEPQGTEHDIWEDLRSLSRRVIKYAEENLRGASQTTSRGSSSPSPEPTPDVLPVSPKVRSNDFVMSTKHGEVRIPSHMAHKFKILADDNHLDVSQSPAL